MPSQAPPAAGQTRASRARQFFGPGGLLAAWHPEFEFRPGQLKMAEEIEAALAEKRHLLVEAGTGTGKTLAYLVPVAASGRRVVISTYTKNLQEQLYYKDIPFLEKHFDRPLHVAYMKGRNNFLCRQKLYDAENKPLLSGLTEIEDFALIRQWESATATGDRAELAKLPETSTVWAKLDARRELCTGQKCPQFERCFISLMHQRAAESDIIIVNHHLFFADLAIRDLDFGSIIPDYSAVVFDEAHEIEDVAGQHFGVALSTHRFEELARDIESVARVNDLASSGLHRTLSLLRERARDLFALLPGGEGRSGFRDRPCFLEKHQKRYESLLDAIDLTASSLKLMQKKTEEIAPLVRRAAEVRLSLEFLLAGNDRSFVYWIERRNRGVFLQATPIDVSQLLAERLFDPVDTVILTSATMAVEDKFDFIRKRLGITAARELIVPGHFDYRKQALLYVPRSLPDPRDPGFVRAAAGEVTRILKQSRGRAFVLFTSYQQMRQVHDLVSFAIEYPTLLQGTAPKTALLEEFRSTPHCVLFATSSFWQGVDVPGEQLSCVIIDRLPFAVPSDPVVEARIRNIREDGGNPFYEYQVPEAVLALKQGFGRLIRNRKDRGVLALLDNRILRQRYGQIFFTSLPDYAHTTEFGEVEKFFQQ
jgi:ATP-dependent DNA helicase DinG